MEFTVTLEVILKGVLLFLSITRSAGQGVISFVETSYIVKEGQMFTIDVLKTGIASSDINVVVEVRYHCLIQRTGLVPLMGNGD